MIYVTSDLHFGHNKPFIYEPRGFSSVDEMNNTIVENWNSIINWNDDVYILGDLMLNDNETGLKLLNQLNGRLHLIRGNHCTDARWKLYQDCDNVVEMCGYATVIKYSGYHFYLSHYPTLTANYDGDKPLKTRIINLCGHVHSLDKFSDMDKGLCYHVELDAHDNKVVSIETIIADIKKYISKKED